MLKKVIKYEDYDGNIREEEHYFNLTKAEVIKWLTTTGGYTLDKVIEQLGKERNGKRIMEIFEDLIYMSYGKKSLDGRRFEKTDEIKRDFMETEAYSILFTELVTDAKKAADFINAIVPKELSDEIERIIRENPDGIPDEMQDYLTDTKKEDNVVSIDR
jgi:hypothetical protein